MSLRVISKDVNDRKGVIVIESPTQAGANSSDAKQLALTTATASGLSRPGFSEVPSPYPVDADGNSSDALIKGQIPVAAYRCDFHVAAMI